MQAIAAFLTDPAVSAAFGFILAFALWADRNKKKLAEIDTAQEVYAIVAPAVLATVAAFAADPELGWKALLGSLALKIGMGLGWNGKPLLPTRRPAATEEPPKATPEDRPSLRRVK